MVRARTRVVLGLLLTALAASLLPAVAGASGPRRAYVSNLDGDTVTPFDVSTGTAGTPIAVNSPRGVAISPDGATVYVANQMSDSVTPIDTQTGTAGTPIAVGDQPLAIAITPDGASVYVANFTSNNVTPIETATGTAGAPIALGASPAGIAITPDGATVYTANHNSNTVTPIDTATRTAGTPIPVGVTAFAIAITPDGATAYVANQSSDNVTPIATSTNTAGTPIAVGDRPTAIAIAPDGATAYVTNANSDDVTPIATAANTAGTPIPAGNFPSAIAITPDGATAYVTNRDSNNVTPIDTATSTAAGPSIAVGSGPWGVAVTPDQAPHAAFGATPAVAASATTFEASGSTDADGTVASYAWDFGDGHSEATAGPAIAHTYADPGTYTVTLTVTDDEGCSTEFVFTGQTASCTGSAVASAQHEVTVPAASKPTPPADEAAPPAAPTPPADSAKPGRAIERFALASRCVRRSRSGQVDVRMNLRLARSGPVRVQVHRAVGTKARGSCPKPRRGRRFPGRFRSVQILRHLEPRVVAAAVRGEITLRLRLEPGLYRITVRAYTDGNKLSLPARRFLRVLG
jgi:YVTN family beta-propeller protein